MKTNPHNSLTIKSGWQDSNLRPPAPKAGALTGLRYTPKNFDAVAKSDPPAHWRDVLTGLRYTPKESSMRAFKTDAKI